MTVVVCNALLMANPRLVAEWTSAVPAVAAQVKAGDMCAPAHFPLETGSLLAAVERQGWIGAEERRRCLDDARIAVTDIDPALQAPSPTITDLAAATRLSVDDAAYLELALRRGASLATNDGRLITAARARGVPVLTIRP